MASFLPKNPMLYALVVVLGCVAVGWFLGDVIGNKVAENRREWERFEASHGGCWRTGQYDVSTSMVPLYGPGMNGQLTIISWIPQDDYTYYWVCRDGTAYKR